MSPNAKEHQYILTDFNFILTGFIIQTELIAQADLAVFSWLLACYPSITKLFWDVFISESELIKVLCVRACGVCVLCVCVRVWCVCVCVLWVKG